MLYAIRRKFCGQAQSSYSRWERNVCIQETSCEKSVGLYARPATFFIQKANEFKSSIWIEKDGRRVNAKSLLGVLSLGVTKARNRILAEGTDEQIAVNSLIELIDKDFSN